VNYYKTAQGYYKPIPEEVLQEIPHGKYVAMRKEYLLNENPEWSDVNKVDRKKLRTR